MDQRIKDLENVIEAMVKHSIDENKYIIETNHSLINELRDLREIVSKQDDELRTFKTLILNQLHNLNTQLQTQQAVLQSSVSLPSFSQFSGSPEQQQKQQQQRLLMQPPPPPPPSLATPFTLPQPVVNSPLFLKTNPQQLSQNFFTQQQPQIQQPNTYLGKIQINFHEQQHHDQDYYDEEYDEYDNEHDYLNVENEVTQNLVDKNLQFSFGSNYQKPQIAQQQVVPNIVVNKEITETKKQSEAAGAKISLTPSQLSFEKTTTATAPKIEFKGASVGFGELAAKAAETTSTKNFFGGTPTTNLFQQKPQPLFDAKAAIETEEGEHEGESHEHPEAYEPKVDFQPIVKLEEVVVKTGEEDEHVLFKERCKLFRFDTHSKEWKEKGVGELKILKHKEHNTYRLLMRRDKVLKVCLNLRITNEIKFEVANEKTVRWTANYFSDGACNLESLIAIFKIETEAKKFKSELDKIQSLDLKAIAKEPDVPEKAAETKPAAAALPTTQTNDDKNKFSFGAPTPATSTTSGALFKFGSQPATTITPSSSAPLFQFGSSPATKPIVPQQQQLSPQTPPQPSTAPFSFSGLAKQTDHLKKQTVEQQKAPPVFAFGQATPTTPSTTNLFSKPPATSPEPTTSAIQNLLFTPPKFSTTAPSPKTEPVFKFGSIDAAAKTDDKSQENVLFKGFDTKSSLGFGDLAKTATGPTTSIFGGTATANLFQQKPQQLFASQAVKPTVEAEEGEHEFEGTNEHPEAYEPKVDFQPIVKLEEVVVKTGEEDEDVVYKERCKLYRYDTQNKEWKEKGVGELKILKHKERDSFRMLMRRDQVLKVCLNQRITNELKFEAANDKSFRWIGNSKIDGKAVFETLLVKYRNEAEAKKFKSELDRIQSLDLKASEVHVEEATPAVSVASGLKPLSEIFKNENKWKCTDCLTFNDNAVPRCACCTMPKPGTTATDTEACTASVATFLNTLSTTQKPVFGSNGEAPASANQFKSLFNFPSTVVTKPTEEDKSEQSARTMPFKFGSPKLTMTEPAKSEQAPFSFNGLAKETEKLVEAKKDEPKPAAPFFNLGQATNFEFKGFGGLATAGPPQLLAAGTGLDMLQHFSSQLEHEEESHEHPEAYEPKVDFQPIVKLEEVVVKTGEEDEEVLFKERSKIYRFDTHSKEWKEKGVGELKILKHKEHNTYRLLMRRDQVLKVCLNHRITNEIKFEVASERAVRWIANDFSEGTVNLESLLAKFKSETEVKKFKSELDKIQSLDLKAIAKEPPKVKEEVKPIEKPLIELFKNENKWKCSNCFAPNDNSQPKCKCCDTAKPGAAPETTNVNNNNKPPPLFGATNIFGDSKSDLDKSKFVFGSTNTNVKPVFGATFGLPTEKEKPKNGDDCVIIKTVTASEEDIQKARNYQLPDNFYLYDNKEKCHGCRGCEKDDN